MPRPAAILTVPRPCAESWDAMTPTTAGRHCAACQKVVVDFTQKTDAELLAYLAGAGVGACGRFRADQVSRQLHPVAPVSRWWAWLASTLALGGVLSASRAAAQARSNYAGPLPVGEVSAPVAPAAAPVLSAPATPATPPVLGAEPAAAVILRGVVTEAESGLPLPGTTIVLAGTPLGTYTDATGRFELTVAAPDTVELVISSIGFATQRLPVTAAQAQVLAVQLHPDVKGLTEVVFTGAYETRKPWPWHPRALYGWTRYRVGRLLGRW